MRPPSFELRASHEAHLRIALSSWKRTRQDKMQGHSCPTPGLSFFLAVVSCSIDFLVTFFNKYTAFKVKYNRFQHRFGNGSYSTFYYSIRAIIHLAITPWRYVVLPFTKQTYRACLYLHVCFTGPLLITSQRCILKNALSLFIRIWTRGWTKNSEWGSSLCCLLWPPSSSFSREEEPLTSFVTSSKHEIAPKRGIVLPDASI